MTHYRLSQISTDKQISLFFTIAVFVIVSAINGIVFYATEQQWEYSKSYYADKILGSVHTKKDAESLDNVRIFDGMDAIVFNAGIFTSMSTQGGIEHNSIVHLNGNSYFVSLAKTKDGGSICYAQDVTEFMNTRNSIIRNTLIFSLIALIFVYIIGIYFARYILRPVRDINDHTRKYSLHAEVPTIQWSGNPNDDIWVLTQTMNSLFSSIHSDAEKIEQFSSDVSHELKNGLSELKTHVQIMLAKQMYSKDCLTQMNVTIDSMGNLVESLILLARLDQITLDMHDVSVKDTILASKEMRSTKIVFEWDDTVARIQAPLFSLAVGNIISNAIKFTWEEGRVFVTIKKNILTIEDDGIGIKSENIRKIWDRFYKESEDREYQSGYGIGLSLTKKILDIHGFPVSVESTVGKGTKFVIQLQSGV